MKEVRTTGTILLVPRELHQEMHQQAHLAVPVRLDLMEAVVRVIPNPAEVTVETSEIQGTQEEVDL